MSKPLPELSLEALQPNRPDDAPGMSMFGYTAESWVRAYRELGPVFYIKEYESVALCGAEASSYAWREPDNWSYANTFLGEAFLSQLGEGYITASDGMQHLTQRTLLSPMFRGNNIHRHCNGLMEVMEGELSERQDQPIELHQELVFIFTKMLNRSMVKSGADDRQICRFARFEEEFIRGATSASPDAWYQRPQYQTLREDVFAYFGTLVQARLDGDRSGDNLDLLIASMRGRNDNETNLDELVRDAYLMQAGGAGNIASLSCSLLWALVQSAEWLPEVTAELESLSPQQLVETGIHGLNATRAAVFESERCFPPTPGLPKQTIRELDLFGYRLPAGTNVMHIFALSHFLEEDYPAPFSFQPDRWIQGRPPKPNAFGGGRHTCIGMHLAYMFVLLALKAVLPKYSVIANRGPYDKPLYPDRSDSPTCMAFDIRLDPN